MELERAKGKTLQFHAANADATELTDNETGSRWDAYGKCLFGLLKGSQLDSLILEPEYWFAWSEFHPKPKSIPPPRKSISSPRHRGLLTFELKGQTYSGALSF